jgi:hypothetical protein
MYVNAKIRPVESVQGIRVREIGERRRGRIQVRYIWYIVRTFVNATMYLHPVQ